MSGLRLNDASSEHRIDALLVVAVWMAMVVAGCGSGPGAGTGGVGTGSGGLRPTGSGGTTSAGAAGTPGGLGGSRGSGGIVTGGGGGGGAVAGRAGAGGNSAGMSGAAGGPVGAGGGSSGGALGSGGAPGSGGAAPAATNAPIAPRWAFEPWVWEDNGNTRASTEMVVGGYQSRHIPVGAVIIDSPWETGYNTLVWDTARYPDPAAMIAQFHANGVKVIMWTTGFVDDDTSVYQTVKQKGYGVNGGADSTWWKGTGIHIDVTNPAAADWWNARMGAVLAGGADGWKLDQGADFIGDPVKTAAGSLSVTEFKKRLSADFYDYSTSVNPNAIVVVRPYEVEQGGGVGSDPAKCSIGWVGDHDGGFGGIAEQLNDIYLSAERGYGAPGVEVGGYFRNAPTKHSLIRYAEFGALTPLMENGGTNGGLKEHLPWSWDAETVDIYRYFATLHSELGAYNFSYSVESHLTGKSIVRSPDKAAAQHLLGDQLLVSVMTADTTSKAVKLPAGQWIDYWNEDMTYAGGQTITYPTPLDRYPLFIRAGATIPLDVKTDVTGHGDASSAGKVTLAVYPSGQSAFVFHRPTGDGVAYTDVTVAVDAVTETIEVSGTAVADYRLRIKSMQAPTGVAGADTWSYDAVAKVIIADKKGAAFTVRIAGLKGYP
ncbi:MAG TPA: TIM-barrel domain-containing protein [Polyangia bacterium]|nr:TIM-barrel domain-containing protein [Polyangia bacterium]